MKSFAILFLFLAIILEASITTLPFLFLVLLSLTVLFRSNIVFLYAFSFGLLIDLLTLRPLGQTSAILVFLLFLVLLYQRKFEIDTSYFVLAASFFGSLGFLLLVGYTNSLILITFSSALIGLLIFKVLKKFLHYG